MINSWTASVTGSRSLLIIASDCFDWTMPIPLHRYASLIVFDFI